MRAPTCGVEEPSQCKGDETNFPTKRSLLDSKETLTTMISPEQNRALIPLIPDEASLASTRSDNGSPILCKLLTPRTPFIVAHRLNIGFASMQVADISVRTSPNVDSADYSPVATQRSINKKTASKTNPKFLPAWRRKNVDAIQRMKLRREGASCTKLDMSQQAL